MNKDYSVSKQQLKQLLKEKGFEKIREADIDLIRAEKGDFQYVLAFDNLDPNNKEYIRLLRLFILPDGKRVEHSMIWDYLTDIN